MALKRIYALPERCSVRACWSKTEMEENIATRIWTNSWASFLCAVSMTSTRHWKTVFTSWRQLQSNKHCYIITKSMRALYNPSNLFRNARNCEIGQYSWTFPSFSWGIFGHVTCLDQSRLSENIWWIITFNIPMDFNFLNTNQKLQATRRIVA